MGLADDCVRRRGVACAPRSAEASGEQARDIEEVSAFVSIMETATEANSRLVEECAEAARAVAAQADLLAQAVSRFQPGEVEAPRPAPERTSYLLAGRPALAS